MSTDDLTELTERLVVDDEQAAPIVAVVAPDTGGLPAVAAQATENTGESVAASSAPSAKRKSKFWLLREIAAPGIVLASLALAPKTVILWIFVIIAKPVCTFIFNRLPAQTRQALRSRMPAALRNSALVRDFEEGADQGLPFILFFLYLAFTPFALIWMAVDWVQGLLPASRRRESIEDGFVFSQNKHAHTSAAETNFYHSRAFGIVLFLLFASGIPALFTFSLYERLGMDRAMQVEPATAPRERLYSGSYRAARPSAEWNLRPPSGADATVVAGYTASWPTVTKFRQGLNKNFVFFVDFYLMSVAWCASVLFFRAWFSFPLNFLSDEHEIEFTAGGIKRRAFKGWFKDLITLNRWATGGHPDNLCWDEVQSLRQFQEGFARLYPLPETAFSKESLAYKILNKVAAFIDGVTTKTNSGNYLVFSTAEKGSDFGRHIKLNLKDLSREQRARLFYSVKQWAPHVVIDRSVEGQLLGSTVLNDNRYTQLWFDILTTKSRPKRQNVLQDGETLKSDEYRIAERITSGGQATTYLATRANDEKCVLKEFVLSTSSDAGALLDSAREFEAEVSLLSQLDHSGIVKLQDFFFEDGRLYVAMDYIEGKSLKQLVLENGPFAEDEVRRIAAEICNVLEYLHGSTPPIVHRDITPENILLQPDGAVKVIDFSLAVRLDGRRTTNSCAKQCFTPPEQFREEACAQSDIYALGATMYFLLTGKTPKPISKSSPNLVAPEISDQMNSIVERATELELARRYDSVQWMKLDLT